MTITHDRKGAMTRLGSLLIIVLCLFGTQALAAPKQAKVEDDGSLQFDVIDSGKGAIETYKMRSDGTFAVPRTQGTAAGASCDAEHEGSIRYNYDASNWKNRYLEMCVPVEDITQSAGFSLKWQRVSISKSVRTIWGDSDGYLFNVGAGAFDAAMAYCADDEDVVGGGGKCADDTAALSHSAKYPKGTIIWGNSVCSGCGPDVAAKHDGWFADCTSPGSVISRAKAYVVCAKK